MIHIDTSTQTLCFDLGPHSQRHYQISTGMDGLGNNHSRRQTPPGQHIVRAKIGAGLPVNTVFIGRRPTGEIYSPTLTALFPKRDWILTRILWLSGTEIGKNRLGKVDTMSHYIYIHGTPDTEPMGVARSHGCIRMRNAELLEFFDLVPIGCKVEIQ